jgi:carbon storage regulator
MLVLSRKINEEILVAGDIAIVVLQISGSRVKLGIRAPKETYIQRGEIREKPSDDDFTDLSIG